MKSLTEIKNELDKKTCELFNECGNNEQLFLKKYPDLEKYNNFMSYQEGNTPFYSEEPTEMEYTMLYNRYCMGKQEREEKTMNYKEFWKIIEETKPTKDNYQNFSSKFVALDVEDKNKFKDILIEYYSLLCNDKLRHEIDNAYNIYELDFNDFVMWAITKGLSICKQLYNLDVKGVKKHIVSDKSDVIFEEFAFYCEIEEYEQLGVLTDEEKTMIENSLRG